MDSLSLSLDDIISSQRKKVGGGGLGRGRRFGGPRRAAPSANSGPRRGKIGGGRFTFSNDTPSGKWKHDKFNEVYGGGNSGGGIRGKFAGGSSRRMSGGGTKNVMKLNISNLPDSVITADLEELFQDFEVFGVTVHYDETGAHLGTADLYVAGSSAADILREFRGIAIDNKEMKFALVDENAAKATVMDRVRRVRANPINARKAGGRRSDGGNRNGIGKGKPAEKSKVMTADELDKELDAYMSIRNAGGSN